MSRALEERRKRVVRGLGADAGSFQETGRLREQRQRGVAGQHRGSVIQRRMRRIDVERRRSECRDQRQQPFAKPAGRIHAEVRAVQQGRTIGPGERLERVEHAYVGAD